MGGDHVRPRVRVPESGAGLWRKFVGEIGYQRAVYSPDIWTSNCAPLSTRPSAGCILCFNPTMDRSFHGRRCGGRRVFTNVKVGYDITKVINGGFEYYGSVGPSRLRSVRQQQASLRGHDLISARTGNSTSV